MTENGQAENGNDGVADEYDLNPTPSKWNRCMLQRIREAERILVSYTRAQRGQYNACGSTLTVRVIEVADEKRGGMRFGSVETSDGFGGSPDQLADHLWAMVQDTFRAERRRRRGKLERITGQVELLDKDGEVIASERAYCYPLDEREAEIMWIGDANDEDARADRSMTVELRRQNRILWDRLGRREQQIDTLVETTTRSVGELVTFASRMLDEREERIASDKAEIEELAIAAMEAGDDRAERREGMAMIMELIRGERSRNADRPNAQGVDALVADCRSVARLMSTDDWAKLIALDADYANVRDAIEAALPFDATRATVRGKLMRAMVTMQGKERPTHTEQDVVNAIGIERVSAILGLGKHFADESGPSINLEDLASGFEGAAE